MATLISTVVGVLIAVLLASALAYKWQLGVPRVVIGVTALGVASAWPVALLVHSAFVRTGAVTVVTLVLATAVLAQRFYRDPERSAPPGDGLLVSPADGVVVYVRRSAAGFLPMATKHGRDCTLRELTRSDLAYGEAVVIGIGMSLLDVHVNRSPMNGRVTARQHFPGTFASLRLPAAGYENERATTVIEGEQFQVAVVQIASRLVRQIVGRVLPGDEVVAGDRIGVIRLGSQVDLILPQRPDLQVLVKPGDRVRAAETIVARVRPGHPALQEHKAVEEPS